MSHLVLERVTKEFGTRHGVARAVSDVTLTVAQGEFVVLLGPSGCGKSTILELVAGLQRPTTGSVRLNGAPICGTGPDRVLIAQQPGLFPWLTALENVAFGLRLAGVPTQRRRETAWEALETMGLDACSHHYPHMLSGGMQQRVALARALVLDPEVLLLDEPLAALDALLRSRLQGEIRRRCAGRTVLWVTHTISEALALADRVVLMTPAPGRVLRELRPDGLAPRPPSPTLAELEGAVAAALAAACEG